MNKERPKHTWRGESIRARFQVSSIDQAFVRTTSYVFVDVKVGQSKYTRVSTPALAYMLWDDDITKAQRCQVYFTARKNKISGEILLFIRI